MDLNHKQNSEKIDRNQGHNHVNETARYGIVAHRHIAIIFLKEIFNVDFALFILDIFILVITILSLIVYAYNWIIDLKTYHNE